MDIKRPERTNWVRISAEKLLENRNKRILVIFLYTCLIFVFGYLVHRSGFSFGNSLQSAKREIDLLPVRIMVMIARPKVEHIAIDIKHEDFMRLAYQRQLALSRGILISDEEDFVPATIQHAGQSVDVRLRLKGDSTDHLEGNKWSFMINVRGDNTLFGMERFSIQHPKTRNYLYEWIFHQALKREGLVSLRYDFIYVILNGKELGIYAIEEHFEKRLIENSQYREGPIVRFNEDMLWEEEFQYPRPRDYIVFNSFLPVDIDTYQTNQMLSDPSKYTQHLRAIYLLEAFRRGELKTSDVFDVQKLATFFAIADLMGAQHSINWSNMRFYYNPITSRLEPIGFDGDSGGRIKALSVGLSPLVDPIFLEAVFNDLLFFEEYVKTLERVSKPSYLDTLWAELNKELKHYSNLLYTEFSDFHFSNEVLYQNQQFINKVLNPVKGLHAYFHAATDHYIDLELGNFQSMPIEVLEVSYLDHPPLLPAEKTILPQRPVSYIAPLFEREIRSQDIVDYQIVRFVLPAGFNWSEEMKSGLNIKYRLLGTSPIREEVVFPFSYLGQDFVENEFFRQEPNVHTFEFLVMDENTRRILVKPGNWKLDRNLIIPEGYQFLASEGVELNLSHSAKILSYSPLEFTGSEERPILIQSSDSTGQGIVVIDAFQNSILKHVIFRNLSSPSQSGWDLTGAVTFYQSPVGVFNSQFIGIRSEDALNIVRSDFSIDKTLFSEIFSDAIDADFSSGKIMNSSFESIGNDAIDVSGSAVEIQNVFVNSTHDKALSVGENSQVVVIRMDIKNAEIALASKDFSILTVENVKISDGEIGITAFQKKPEFGAASVRASGIEMSSVNTPYLIEELSTVIIDGELIAANGENLKDMLYRVKND